jgi:kynurenine formamidase
MPGATTGHAVQSASVTIDGQACHFDAARPHSLAIELDFDGQQPHWFGGASARSTAVQSGSFTGSVASGASCNCSMLSFTPHCDGTHTECAGHLTRERCDARSVVPQGFLAALLLSVVPVRGAQTTESSDPAPRAQDALITRQALAQAWPAGLPFSPRVLIVRTLPNPASKRHRDYAREAAPYLTLPAAQWLVERGIEHLVLDVPSADRADDGGRLSAHREFFGLAPGSSALADVRRPGSTITELAWIDDALPDGPWLLAFQVPALAGDAVPSRPLLYRLLVP